MKVIQQKLAGATFLVEPRFTFLATDSPFEVPMEASPKILLSQHFTLFFIL